MISKTSSILLGGLLAGTLLTGAGVGVTAIDIMSFEIDTETLEQSSEVLVEELSFSIEDYDKISISNPNCRVEFDEAVSPGTMFVSIEHMPDASYISSWIEIYERGAGTKDHTTLANFHFYTYPHQQYLITHKDELLQGLKDRRLLVYESHYSDSDDSVKIVKLNPADKNRLNDRELSEHWEEYSFIDSWPLF